MVNDGHRLTFCMVFLCLLAIWCSGSVLYFWRRRLFCMSWVQTQHKASTPFIFDSVLILSYPHNAAVMSDLHNFVFSDLSVSCK